MGSHHNHWPPSPNEFVTVFRREDQGLNPDGYIVDVDDWEVTVQYYGDSVDYSQQGVVRINGIAYPSIVTVLCPDMLLPQGYAQETFQLDDFHHRWSSLSGGQGRWIIQD